MLVEDLLSEGLERGRDDDKVVWRTFLRWVRLTRGFSLYPYQSRPARSVLGSLIRDEGRTFSWLFPRQSGKTEAASCLAAYVAVTFPTLWQYPSFLRGVRIGVFAPKEEQAQIMFRRLKHAFDRDLLRELFDIEVVRDVGHEFELSNGSVVRCITAAENSPIEGETFHLLLPDEMQAISDDKWHRSIEPMGNSTNATTVFTGTPALSFLNHNGMQCHMLYEHVRKGVDSFVFRAQDIIADRRVAHQGDGLGRHLLWERKYVKKVEEVGEEDDYLRTQYNCQWILEDAMFCLPSALRALQMHYARVRIPHPATIVHPLYVGIDWAKIADSTVVTVVQRRQDDHLYILDWLEIKGEEYDVQVADIAGYLERFGRGNLKRIVVDSTGAGDPVYDMLRNRLRMGGGRLVGLKFTAVVNDHLYRGLQLEISKKTLHYPEKNLALSKESRKFYRQMTTLQKEYRGDLLRTEAPERAGSHDDYCDSLAMAIHGARGFVTIIGPRIIDATLQMYDPARGQNGPSIEKSKRADELKRVVVV